MGTSGANITNVAGDHTVFGLNEEQLGGGNFPQIYRMR